MPIPTYWLGLDPRIRVGLPPEQFRFLPIGWVWILDAEIPVVGVHPQNSIPPVAGPGP